MDKNTIIALLLIGGILLGFTWYNGKQASQYAEEKARMDSIALVQERLTGQTELKPSDFNEGIIPADGTVVGEESASALDVPAAISPDSARKLQMGDYLYEHSQGSEEYYKLENNLMTVTVSNLGARITDVTLKNYNKYGGGPLKLAAPGTSDFDLSFYILKDYNNYQLNTSRFYFKANTLKIPSDEDGGPYDALSLRLHVTADAYLEYLYIMKPDDYMVDFKVNFINMADLFSNQSELVVNWTSVSEQNEKGYENENNNTSIFYKYPGEGGVENLAYSSSSKEKNEAGNVQWIAFKQQFFSSIFIADERFSNAAMRYDSYEQYSGLMKKFSASIGIPFNKQTTEYGFKFYFGPNKYSLLKQYKLDMERLVPLGGWAIRWVNTWIVIPVFDWLGNSIASFGLIILILTIFIKLLIFPLTYKSYLSMAKMRLLKPELEELTERYPKQEDAMKKQQATMEMYKKAGVNPMGGCLPLLIQFPILIAMFRFFPASIELRQESFLWADDLSSYDSILELPFNIPFYGDHVSLFTLLMAVMLFVSSRLNYNQQAQAPQMAGMKFMMLYLFPLMFVFWFNNYSSGLSYYYLVSTLITIGQTYAFRYIVNDEKLHARMKANAAKKTPKKKSKWQQRYEDMMKAQQQQAAAQAKKKK